MNGTTTTNSSRSSSSSNKARTERRRLALRKRLHKLANRDEWEKCRSLLLSSQGQRRRQSESDRSSSSSPSHSDTDVLWSNSDCRTGGQSLLHLAAFAAAYTAGTTGGPSHDNNKKRQLAALQCLDVLLEMAEAALSSSTVVVIVNKVAASNGGTPLHAAIAAAAASTTSSTSSIMSDDDDDDDDDVSTDETTTSTFSDTSTTSYCSNEGDDDVLWERDHDWSSDNSDDDDDDDCCNNNNNNNSVLQFSKYEDLNSEQMAWTAIDLLLRHGAGPNKPMGSDAFDDMEQQEEEDLIYYSREAIMEQWTPLTLCLVWTALASLTAQLTLRDGSSTNSCHDDDDMDKNEKTTTLLLLPIKVLYNLRVHGADPYRPMGGAGTGTSWNGVELLASCSHCFVNTRICSDVLRQQHGIVVERDSNDNKTVSVLKCLQQMVHSEGMPELISRQASASALIANDVDTASNILTSQSGRHKWRTIRWNDLLPMPQATWCASLSRTSWTILSACVAVMATSSIHFLLSTTCGKLSEEDAIQSIGIVFSNTGMASDVLSSLHEMDDNDDEERRQVKNETCAAIVNAVHPSTCTESPEKRQMFLDRLLLRACSDAKWGDLEAVDALLGIGANPDADSVASFVASKFRPLHFVAANRYGRKGVAMAKALVDSGANPDICDANDELPLDLALKYENHFVVEYLWQTTNETRETISASSAYEFGLSAVACQSLSMLRIAVASIKCSVQELGMESAETALGQILLACVDERSGFKVANEADVDGSCPLVSAVSALLEDEINTDIAMDRKETATARQEAKPLPTLECNEISKYTTLHSILRHDRGKDMRLALLTPLCDLAKRRESRGSRSSADLTLTRWINLPCDAKFGSYTALHLACALGCEESIQTLLRFGADKTLQDCEGNRPFQLLPSRAQLSPLTIMQLSLDLWA